MGNYRTAVFAYLFAKQNGGKLLVRIEDTDKERSKVEYKDNILESLAWLGIAYDTLYIQSENIASHRANLTRLIEEGKAYISKEEAKDGSGIIKELVRFKNPNKKVTFNDLIRGEITTDTTDLGDFVIARSIDDPIFHFAVVVDDHDEGVTHVIRGEDHIANTPRQMLIQEALGFPTPAYAHLPLVLGEDRAKLSKRKGALPVTAYKDLGYLPDALFNFMAFIGWNPGGEREVYTKEDLVPLFDITKIQKGGAVCNVEKLQWFNKEHIALQTKEAQLEAISTYFEGYNALLVERMLPLVLEKIHYYGEIPALEPAEFRYLKMLPKYDKEILLWKDTEVPTLETHLKDVFGILSSATVWDKTSLHTLVFPYAEQHGKGQVLSPLRVALSGQMKSADPFTVLSILGKDESLKRINHALSLFASMS
jgi:glutamyl-tRNA synthetase